MITIANDNDVLLAIQTNKVLRLTIYCKFFIFSLFQVKFNFHAIKIVKNKNYEQTGGDADGLKEITSLEILKELQSIRTSIDKFYENFGHLITKSAITSSSSSPQQQTQSKSQVIGKLT